jgi:hypothetical protein
MKNVNVNVLSEPGMDVHSSNGRLEVTTVEPLQTASRTPSARGKGTNVVVCAGSMRRRSMVRTVLVHATDEIMRDAGLNDVFILAVDEGLRHCRRANSVVAT